MLLALLALATAQDAPAPAPPPAPDAAEEPPPLVKMPALVHFVEAPYPAEAREQGLEAKVLLAIEVDATGAVTNVEVLRPAGHGFDEAAVEAARQLRFSPAEDATGPVPVVIEFEYGFALKPEVAEAPAEAEAPVNLEGTLREMGTRAPLAGFVVRVEPDGLEATTDADGKWSFRGVPAGARTVRVVRPGYDTLEQPVEVAEGEATTAKLWLRNQSYRDEGIVGTYRPETADVSRRTISMEEVKRIPGTFGDPIRVVQNLPGAARSPFGSGLLVIRGSNPEDSGVYIDGIRIPYIYHLGGLESVVNPDLVGAVDYLPGGYGPRYGRSMGGVVDVRTRDEFPERTKVVWSTDLLDSGFLVMGRAGAKDQHGFGVAARRSYVDAVLPLFLDEGFVVRPRWFDYQAKYAWQGDGPGRFSLLAFGFQDVLFASTPPGSGAQGTDPSTQGDLGTTYSTHRVLLTWELPVSEHWKLRMIPSFGRDFASLVLGNDWRLDQGQWMIEVRGEGVWEPSEHLKVVSGVDFIGGWADFDVEIPFDPAQFAEIDPLAEREPFVISDTQDGWGPDLYVQGEWRPLAEPEALLVSPGVRFDYITIPGEFDMWALDPRLAAKLRVLPTSHVKGSVGLYHQPPQPYQTYRQDEAFVDLDAERALTTSIGWEQEVGPAIRAEIELFWKEMSDLIVDNPSFDSLDDPFFTNEGTGRAYGLELMVRHEPVGNLFGWVSYTLSRSERQDHPGEEVYPFELDQTHILVALAGYRLPYDFEIGAKGQYVTGNPTTGYALGIYDIDQDGYQGFRATDWNGERLPPYWAVHLRVDKLFTFKAWQLQLYLDLLNVVRGVNPEFEVYNYDYTESTYIRGLPFIPSPGFEARFEF